MADPARPWYLSPGDQLKRTELHKAYGGRGQGGIGPSAQSPNVFLFTDPASGELHGYRDAWGTDGVFHYTGEGQRGDQQFKQGNRAVRDHREEGRALRLFEGVGGTVTYLGEFELAKDGYYFDDAPETGNGPLRQVIVFRLQPVGDLDQASPPTIDTTRSVGPTRVPLESHRTDTFEISPNAELIAGARREQPLLLRYAEHLRSQGHEVTRHAYNPDAYGRSLYSDAFDEHSRTLIESKASCSREAIRMAIGQLLDYAHLEQLHPDGLVVLVPSRPRDDLVALLHSVGIQAIYPDGRDWASTRS